MLRTDYNISFPCGWCHLETGEPFVKSTEVEGDNADHKIHAARFHEKCIIKKIQQPREASCPLCRKRITHVNGVEIGSYFPLPPLEREADSISSGDRDYLGFIIENFLHLSLTVPSADALAAIENATRAIILSKLAPNPTDRPLPWALAGAALGRLAVIEDFVSTTSSGSIRVPRILYLCTIERFKLDIACFNTFFPKDSDDEIAAVSDATSAAAFLDQIASSVFSVLDGSLLSIPCTNAGRKAARRLAPALRNSFSHFDAESFFSQLLPGVSQTRPYEVAASDVALFKRVRLSVRLARDFANSSPYAVVRALGAAAARLAAATPVPPATQPELCEQSS